MTQQFNQILARMEAIRHSREQRIFESIDSAQWSVDVFTGNCAELNNYAKRLEEREEAFKLWDVSNRDKLQVVFREIGRLLQNFLGSSMALVDHTRVHLKDLYAGEAFLEDYRREIRKRFVTARSWHPVVQGLRIYAQHRKLPDVGSILKYDVHDQESRLVRFFNVPTGPLTEWDGWTKPAKSKLETLEHGIHIRTFVTEYEQEISSFYNWLWGRQHEIHRDDFERLNRMKDQAKLDLRAAGYSE